jgi:hypothetical protein
MLTIIQIWFGDKIPANNKKCIKKIKDFAKLNNIEYNFIQKENVKESQYESDLLRFKLASETKDLLYIDCDCYLKSLPEFKYEDKPYFQIFNNQPCSGIFYNNNCFDFFKILLNESLKRSLQSGISWSNKLLRNKDIYKIDDNCFEHIMFSYNKLK